jgi:glycosyltransferase involved in cell wall biosynthesis
VVYLIDAILVKSDPIINQSSIRAMQITKSLLKDYSVLSLGWNRGSIPFEYPSSKDYDAFHLFNLKAPYAYERFGKLRLVVYFPIFWLWVFIKLCKHRPRIIHACDLATVAPCYLYKLLFRRKLIFDVLDRYGMTYVPNEKNVFFRALYSLINSVEEFYAKKSDVLIAVSEKIFLTFRKKPKKCITIMNCPEDYLSDRPRQEDSSFRLLYTGAIRRGRGLEILGAILLDLKDTELVVTGKVKDLQLQSEIVRIPNIKYHGFLDRNDLLDLESTCHVMVALYDLKLQSQYEYGVANKVLEAMMCGVAVITNISHDLVNDTKCGILVDYGNINQIRQAIVRLKDDPELRKLYATNGRQAFLKKYNWAIMEEKLLKTYEDLLTDHIKANKR